MKIGVLELLAGTVSHADRYCVTTPNLEIRRQYASVMPQAVAVWCRQLGHEVTYATYYGKGDPRRCLPSGLDVVFLSCCTHASALAYALAKLYRQEKITTILGGPHAKSFPEDASRFFDVVVGECDRELVGDLLKQPVSRGMQVSSGRPLRDIPCVEERLPEIAHASFRRGRPSMYSNIPLLTSIGCPYTCDFCRDWNNDFASLSPELLKRDLEFVSRKYGNTTRVSFHDPNFAVRFDQVLGILESLPKDKRVGYLANSSLSILRDSRLPRLKDTNCWFLAPGVESWEQYSNKSGVGHAAGEKKVAEVATQFAEIHNFVPNLQANLIFGLDTDQGHRPVELTKSFATQTPYVWQLMHIPLPFGGTPFYSRLLEENRILPNLPLAFYALPYLVIQLKHYSAVEYYTLLLEICENLTSWSQTWRRWKSLRGIASRAVMLERRKWMLKEMREYREILHHLQSDPQMSAYHEGRSRQVPNFYHRRLETMLGSYASLLSPEDRIPVHQSQIAWERPKPSSRQTTSPDAAGSLSVLL